jgi:predicted transcriptional regulator
MAQSKKPAADREVTLEAADVAYAKKVLAFESLWVEGFGSAYDMFRNQAWHAMMTVFIADSEDRIISVEQAFERTSVSAQALDRYVRILISNGIFRSNADSDRAEVRLTDKATQKMREIFQRMSTSV